MYLVDKMFKKYIVRSKSSLVHQIIRHTISLLYNLQWLMGRNYVCLLIQIPTLI